MAVEEMRQFLIFPALYPAIAMLVFITPEAVNKGIPASDDLLAWLIASYPIAIIPALLMAWVDQALNQPLRFLKTAAIGGVMSASIALFLWSGFAGLWSVVMAFLVGAIPTAVCSWLPSE